MVISGGGEESSKADWGPVFTVLREGNLEKKTSQ